MVAAYRRGRLDPNHRVGRSYRLSAVIHRGEFRVDGMHGTGRNIDKITCLDAYVLQDVTSSTAREKF